MKNRLPYSLLGLFLSLTVHASQIAHYDFGDGNLYDNELGPSYTLVDGGLGNVTLNHGDGTAVFTSATSSSNVSWLETNAGLTPTDFTVSFWFKTATVNQGGQFQGLFSSGTSGVLPGTWQIQSDGFQNDGNLGCRFDGNDTTFGDIALHNANTWYHVVIRKDSDAAFPTKVYLTPVDAGVIGAPSFKAVNNNSTLDKFVLGVNRGTNQSYGMEAANIRIFDDSIVPIDLLFNEGPTAGTLAIPAIVDSFEADDYYVDAGASVQLSWNVYEASTVTIDNGVGDVSTLTSGGLGQTQVTINATTTFTITATNAQGSDQQQITVNVGPDLPVITSFNLSDYYVDTGESVTLNWETLNGTVVTLSSHIGSLNPIDSVIKIPNTTTTYTLSVSNSSGTVEESVTVNVGPPRPNIIIFLVDDMGITDTSVPFIYDGASPQTYSFNNLFQTPNMETLASRGILFSRAYAQTVCSPTRTSLMTGLNSTGHGVSSFVLGDGTRIGTFSPLNYRSQGMTTANEETLPRWLGRIGYRTIHVGKAHFTYENEPFFLDETENPTFLGFDVNIAGSAIGQPGSYLGTNNYATFPGLTWKIPGLEDHHGSNKFLTEACTIEAMEQVDAAVSRGQPFFLHLSHYAVHTPFTTDPRATGDYTSAGAVGSDPNKFCTMMEGVDLSLGDVITHLENLGIAEETLIIFLGDNGSDNPLLNSNAAPDSGWDDFPMRGMKGNRSEGGVRIPLIVSWAKNDPTNPLQQALPITGGSHEDDCVTVWDIPVTAASIAGADIPATVHGYDLSNYFTNTPGEHRPQQFLIYHPHGRNGDYWANYYDNDYKLIYRWDNDTYQLFNLANDPTESNDLANDPGIVSVIGTFADFTTDVGNLSGGFGPGWFNGGVFDGSDGVDGGWDAGDYDWQLGEDSTASDTSDFDPNDFSVSSFFNSGGAQQNSFNNIRFSRASSPASATTAGSALTVFSLTVDILSGPSTVQVTTSFGASTGGTTGYQVYLNDVAIGGRTTISTSAESLTSSPFTLNQGDKLYFVVDSNGSNASDLRGYNFTIQEVSVSATQGERILRMARGMAQQFEYEWGIYGELWPQFTDPENLTVNVMGTLDLDGDGLIDADEDVNGNGLVDSGETSPDDTDTDKDSTDDFSEIRLGLSPTDASESFKLNIAEDPVQGYQLTWPSQPGLSFTIRTTNDLSTATSSWPAQTGVPASAGNNTTWTYTGSEQEQFFIIELE